MDTLNDLLKKYSPEEPPEAVIIKQYVQETFKSPSVIAVQDAAIIITVTSAPLANALRLRTTHIQALCGTNKRLVFRIG